MSSILADAMARNSHGGEVAGAVPFVPPTRSLAVLGQAAQLCEGCNIYRNATQAVFGEMQDPSQHGKVQLMMVGEQPGDREDKEGHPFVGPAGKLLDRALREAAIERGRVYVTNAVKHFKWEPRGKLRIHKKPNVSEISACRPWLEAELHVIKPALVVCLGAVAAQAFLGRQFKVTQAHGKVQRKEGFPPILATAHPASILRALREEDRHRQMAELIADLQAARTYLESQ